MQSRCNQAQESEESMLNYPFDKILFIDIETVSQTGSLGELSEAMQHLWSEKFVQFKQRQPERFTEECDAAMAYEQSAAIFAEFGRVVCISVGFIYQKNGEWYLSVKSFANKDEKTL